MTSVNLGREPKFKFRHSAHAAPAHFLEPDPSPRILFGWVGLKERSVKALLGIAGGFLLTLAVFASGLAFAAWLLAAL